MNVRYIMGKEVFSCRGMTLIELQVAMAIGLLLVAGASQVLQQIYILLPRAESSMLAMRQVQFAGHWIDRDATMAQLITPSDNLTHTLSATQMLYISYVNWNSENTTVSYSVDANNQLQRLEVVKNMSGATISSNQMQVADSITSLTAQYAQPVGMDRKALTVTIVAQLGSVSENRTYRTSPRSF